MYEQLQNETHFHRLLNDKTQQLLQTCMIRL